MPQLCRVGRSDFGTRSELAEQPHGSDRTPRVQTNSGGLSLWPNRRATQGTTYAGIFLRGRTPSFLWPDGMRDPWISYQRNVADRWHGSGEGPTSTRPTVCTLFHGGSFSHGRDEPTSVRQAGAAALGARPCARPGHMEVDETPSAARPRPPWLNARHLQPQPRRVDLQEATGRSASPTATTAIATPSAGGEPTTQTTAQLLRALSLFTVEQSATSPAITLAVDRGSERELARLGSGLGAHQAQPRRHDRRENAQRPQHLSRAALLCVTQTAIPTW